MMLKISGVFRKSLLLIVLFSLASCLYPEAPSALVVSSTQIYPNGTSEWVRMAPYKRPVAIDGAGRRQYVIEKRTKNLLLIAADNVIGAQLKPELTRIYKRDVRLEEVLWWFYAPRIQKTYNNVLRLHFDGFNKKTFAQSLRTMESLKQEYDVMLLAHGIPNNLIASPGQGVVNFRDIDELKGKLHYADALYLQACFGDSLQKDFLAAGFRSVIAYNGLNWNFFYPQYLLDELAYQDGDVSRAHEKIVRIFSRKLSWDLQDREILKRVFGQKPAEYLENVQLPKIFN